jgi:hypothetical protein
MKNIILKLMVFVVFATSLQGCYGKFALTRKLYALNGEVSDKFLRSGLTWAFLIFPVYEVVGLADFIVFNSIEFWSGKNMVTEGEKTFQYVDGVDRYDIHALKHGDSVSYSITHYNFDSYVDTLQVDWNIAQDTAQSRFISGNTVTENFASRKIDGVHVQLRQFGALPQMTVLASK